MAALNGHPTSAPTANHPTGISSGLFLGEGDHQGDAEDQDQDDTAEDDDPDPDTTPDIPDALRTLLLLA